LWGFFARQSFLAQLVRKRVRGRRLRALYVGPGKVGKVDAMMNMACEQWNMDVKSNARPPPEKKVCMDPARYS
jgi:hypothetical protein